jgi:hypothetical protein
MPGAPTTAKATLQPKNSFNQPPRRKPNKMPIFTPVEYTEIAVALFSGGKISEIME